MPRVHGDELTEVMTSNYSKELSVNTAENNTSSGKESTELMPTFETKAGQILCIFCSRNASIFIA